MPKNKLLIAQIIIEGAKIIENRKPVSNLRVGALFENSTSPYLIPGRLRARKRNNDI